MIKKISKPTLVFISFGLFLIIIGLIVSYKISNQTKILDSLNILPVETIVFNPEKYPDTIGVTGTVNKILDKKTFLLGCQDKCISVPVSYNGKSPDLGQDVTIYGKLIKQNGKYVFLAEKLNPTK